MQIELPWEDDAPLKLTLPDTWQVTTPAPAGDLPRSGKSEAEVVKAALSDPEGPPPLSAHSLHGRKVLIIVDDNTRPTPADRFFGLVLKELTAGGADPENILVVPALGIHTALSEEDMAEKIGRENLDQVAWENHDAFDAEANQFFGNTDRGTTVSLNRHVSEADLIVLIGMIEPHLMAGFGGGLKNILPGVAAAETIGTHHEILAEPPYQANRVGWPPDDNTFRTDLEQCRRMIDAEIFCVNVSLDAAGNIAACFAGDPLRAHRRGVDFCLRHSGLSLERPVDGIIVNAHPMDFNFKQSMKCVGNALPALKPGGVVMGFLRAERGLDDIADPKGSPLPRAAVKRILRLIGASRVYGFLQATMKGVNVEEKFLYYYTLQLIRQYDLFFYVPSLSPDIVKALFFFKGFTKDPQAVIDKGRRRLGKRAEVAVFPEGGATFATVEREEAGPGNPE